MADNDTERKPLLDGDNHEFDPVDHVAVRQRRRRLKISVVVVCFVGLGLSLAVALPLANHSGGVGGGSPAGDAQQVNGGLLMMGSGEKYRKIDVDIDQYATDSADEPHTTATATATTTHRHPTMSWRPWWWNYVTTTPSSVADAITAEADTSTASTRHRYHSVIPTWWPRPWWWDFTKTTPSSVADATTAETDTSTASTRHGYYPIIPTWWPRPWWWDFTKTATPSVTDTTIAEADTSTASTRHGYYPIIPTRWPRPWWWDFTRTTTSSVIDATTAEADTYTASTRHKYHPTIPTWWPWRRNATTSKPSTHATDVTTATHFVTTAASTAAADATTAAWLPETCPRVSSQIKDRVRIEDVISTPIWYELLRVQSYNSPPYVDQVSCSTMQLTSSSPLDAEAQLDWEEGSLYYREKKSTTLYLHRQDESSADWLESVNRKNSTQYQNQFSILARVDGFLLVYECFPYVTWRPNPGYAIRVYSSDPRPSAFGQRLADVLLSLADRWGLNPARLESIGIRQRLCNIDVGRA